MAPPQWIATPLLDPVVIPLCLLGLGALCSILICAPDINGLFRAMSLEQHISACVILWDQGREWTALCRWAVLLLPVGFMHIFQLNDISNQVAWADRCHAMSMARNGPKLCQREYVSGGESMWAHEGMEWGRPLAWMIHVFPVLCCRLYIFPHRS